MNFKEHYLLEMPFPEVDGVTYDLNLQDDYWDEKLIETINELKLDPVKVDELLRIFKTKYWGQLFVDSFNSLKRKSKERAKNLLTVLPTKFKEDMGLKLDTFNLKDMFNKNK